MPEFEVRIHQPVVTTMKVINYTDMTIAGLSWLDVQIEAMRLVEATPPHWDGFDVVETMSSTPEGAVEVYSPGYDDTTVIRLMDGRLDPEDTEKQLAYLETLKDQLSPANYAWIKKDIAFRQDLYRIQEEKKINAE